LYLYNIINNLQINLILSRLTCLCSI
jgi:hypothetical protein